MDNIPNHLPTAELQALDAAHHLHPFTDGDALKKKGARVITSASGVYLTDSEGNKLLDAMSGLWCVNIGYGRHELADAAQYQMKQLPYYNTFFQTSHLPVISLSKKLSELSPDGFNNVFFASSGSEANDTNIRICRHYWATKGKITKKTIISRHNSYHGSTMGGASLGGMGYMHSQGGMPIPDITHIDQPYWYGEGGDSSPEEFGIERAQQLELKILELGEENVAAFIAEPIQGAGGVIVPPETYWPEIQRICDAYEILLIADEVICGFGRTGNLFGSETLNISPDIMTIAKGLSSGYAPIGGSLVSDEVADVINSSGEFSHGYTYSGHPVSCAVALENIRILEDEKIIQTARCNTMPNLTKKWSELINHPLVGDVNILGFMGSIALTPEKASRAKFASPEGTVGLICREHCFSNNLVMRHVGDRMVISPPLIISNEEIDILISRVTKSLDQTLFDTKKLGLYKAS
jgi:putrescine aminotransferase